MSSTTPTQIIRPPTPSELASPSLIAHTTQLVNDAYQETEQRLHKPGLLRTNPAEVAAWMRAGQLHLAFDSTSSSSLDNNSDNNPIGTVRVYALSTSPPVFDLGTLAVRREQRSSGLGRRLIAYAEDVARRGGGAAAEANGVGEGEGVTMRLELLAPKPPATHEFKEFLRSWYGKLGYVVVGRLGVEEVVPHLAVWFEEGLEFLVMEKRVG